MSYSKTTWKTGDTITAQLLNHAEDGIAANDAAIAAIPAGVQLYGPYLASNSDVEVTAGSNTFAELETLEDVNGITVNYPTDKTAKLFLAYFTAALSGFAVQAVYPPYVTNNAWSPAAAQIANYGDMTGAGTVTVAFYSTVEFPQES